MKRIIIALSVFALLVPALSFSSDLEGIADITLSSGVSGYYFDDGAAEPTAYSLSTGHSQGTKVFASGSGESVIYTKDIDGDSFASSDLLQKYSSDLSSETDWTAM
jgi:hypothetical protein